jgi:outer membrane lipoprotein-sorting protein
MKRLILFATFAVLLAANSGFAFDPPNGNLDEILANMQQAARRVSTLKARLLQENRDRTIGGKGQVYSGQLTFQHGSRASDKVRIDYDRPAGQVICVAGEDIILYQPSIKQVTITRRRALAAKNQEFDFIATPYDSVTSLRARYDIVHAGDEQLQGGSVARLELTPKTKSSVKKLTLWVSQSSWLPIKYEVLEVNNSLSTFTLSDISMNAKLEGDAFKVKWPGDVKVVRP